MIAHSSSEPFSIYPGIELNQFHFCSDSASHTHPSKKEILSITCCFSGRIGWKLNDGTELYLGPGDIAVNGMNLCSASNMRFPLGFCDILSISADLEELNRNPLEILEYAGISTLALYERFCVPGKALILSATDKSQRLLADFYQALPELRTAIFKLKVQELLLLLWTSDLTDAGPQRLYTQQTEIIRQVHRQITQNLSTRYTIEELARQYHLNTSTLKQVFKAVYGQPIAAYMKEYRIRCAMQLLRTTDESVADIAARLGYRSQSRFSEAFKDVTQMLPSDYRNPAEGIIRSHS